MQIPLNMIEQSFIVRACLFWPKFYYCLFKPNKNRRKIWEIITSPSPIDERKASKQSNRIPCLNTTFSCFSYYQVQWEYSHLNQRHEKIKMRQLPPQPPLYSTMIHCAWKFHMYIYWKFFQSFPTACSNQFSLLHLYL